MPRPRPLSRFPSEYPAVFARAILEPIRIRFSAPSGAERLRMSFYTYRASLLDQFESHPRLALMSLALRFSIEPEPPGAILHVGLSGEAETSAAIRETLNSPRDKAHDKPPYRRPGRSSA